MEVSIRSEASIAKARRREINSTYEQIEADEERLRDLEQLCAQEEP